MKRGNVFGTLGVNSFETVLLKDLTDGVVGLAVVVDLDFCVVEGVLGAGVDVVVVVVVVGVVVKVVV